MRKILIILGILVLIGIAATVTLIALGGKEETPSEPAESAVQLEGTSEATELDPADNDAAQSAVQDMLDYNEPDSSGTYTVTVRDGSIVNTTTSYGAPKLRYLVDIPELQRTFIVEREGDMASDFASLYVRCPAEADLKYGPKTCKEIE